MLKKVANLFLQETKGDHSALFIEMSSLINEAVNAVIMAYGNKLIGAPIEYIISAIWGGDGKNKPDRTQKEIHNYIDYSINRIVSLLELNKLTKEQIFAIEYLIRSLLVTRIGYAIEKHISKNLLEILSTEKRAH